MKQMYQSQTQSQQKPPEINDISLEVRNYFASHSQSHRDMWGYLLWMNLKVGRVHPTQTHISDHGGIGRSQANLNLNAMKRDGILTIYNRGYKKTCVYRMPSLHPNFLLQLTDIFPWLYNHVRYALLINCSHSNYRTQVFKYNIKSTVKCPGGVAVSLKPSIFNPLNWTNEDYEEFARCIDGESDNRSIGGSEHVS